MRDKIDRPAGRVAICSSVGLATSAVIDVNIATANKCCLTIFPAVKNAGRFAN
jgi:hypothetical protein